MWIRPRYVMPLTAAVTSALQLQPLPPIRWVPLSAASGFSLPNVSRTIYLEADFASQRDPGGLTLIPPSAEEFARTFQRDLRQLGGNWSLEVVERLPDSGSGIYLGKLTSNASGLLYENGEASEEGYEIVVQHGQAIIKGTGARGMWWGTRTLLQELLISNLTIPAAAAQDAPAYATRGFMLDAGRKWYSLSFLKSLCSYASFFKINEFHYHASDNYPLNRGHNETWQDVYSQFSLHPDNPDLHAIIQRPNETLSRDDFEDFQAHCAQRGVTVIPEIEAPGHCLAITKWKPELALVKKDLLNLTHPDAVPTVKSLWTEFLPWFKTKVVHIGADEYDSELADDYIKFVNEMAVFMNTTAGKRIRIWGTYEPSEALTILPTVIIQHWQYGQSDPVQLSLAGIELINSEDWLGYMSIKNDHSPINPAPYPQFFNRTRTLNFANQKGWQWQPALYNPVNISQQLDSNTKGNRGAIMAAWNDNGPDASTQLEAYYAMRGGIPLFGARAWSGGRGVKVIPQSLDASIDVLAPSAPEQNLDRRLDVHAEFANNSQQPLLVWEQPGRLTSLGLGSKGMNYTLSLKITGPFSLSSSDTTLSLSPNGTLSFFSDGWEYPLRSIAEDDGYDPGHPGRIWVNATSSTHEQIHVSLSSSELLIKTDVVGGSRVWVDGEFRGRFEVFVFGGRNTLFSWSQMAFVAPLDSMDGGIKQLIVWEGLR